MPQSSQLIPSYREAGKGMELAGAGDRFQRDLEVIVEQIPLFRDFARNEVGILAGFLLTYDVAKGATLFHEGAKGDSLYVVLKGQIDLFKEAGPRNYKKIHTVRDGKTMGEMSLLDGLPYSASAVATEPSRVLLMTKMKFARLTEEQPPLALKLVTSVAKLLSLRLRQTTGILLDHIE
mgnify:CR=1 FL=1